MTTDDNGKIKSAQKALEMVSAAGLRASICFHIRAIMDDSRSQIWKICSKRVEVCKIQKAPKSV
jgi:hypothetical protein